MNAIENQRQQLLFGGIHIVLSDGSKPSGQAQKMETYSNYGKYWEYGLGKLPGVKGVTKGRNNQSAVFRSGLTKLRNGNARRMSSKVIAKGIRSTIVGGIALDVYYGVKQRVYNPIKKWISRWWK